MKKNDKHELLCGCQDCKRRREAPDGFWLREAEGLFSLAKERPEEPEKQGLPKEPDAVPPDGGG